MAGLYVFREYLQCLKAIFKQYEINVSFREQSALSLETLIQDSNALAFVTQRLIG